MMRQLGLFLLLVQCSVFGSSAAKIKRVKAGKNYEQHDPVHIVVNKVG